MAKHDIRVEFGERGVRLVSREKILTEEFKIDSKALLKSIDNLILSEEVGLNAYTIIKKSVEDLMGYKLKSNINSDGYNYNDSSYYILLKDYIYSNKKVKERFERISKKLKAGRKIREKKFNQK